MTDDWKPSLLIEPILRNKIWFCDADPSWIECKGTPHERECQSAAQARKIRNWTARNIRRMAKRDPAMQEVADALEGCPKRRCGSGACHVCSRAQQRWHVATSREYLEALRSDLTAFSLLTFVPDFGLIPLNELTAVSIEGFKRRLSACLHEAGISLFIGGWDVALALQDGDWVCQMHVHGLGFPLPDADRDRLKPLLNESRGIKRPIRRDEYDGDNAGLAYAAKTNFSRRDAITTDPSTRASHRNTRQRPLEGPALRRVLQCLHNLGLEKRLIFLGCKRRVIDGKLTIISVQ